MKNALFNFIRPNFMDNQENERKEDMPTMNMETTTTTNTNNQTEPESYPSVNYGFLNADCFTNESMNIRFAEPRNMEDAETIAEVVKAGKSVIMYVEHLEKDLAQRILDFVSGVCYAYSIKIDQVKLGYVIDPSNKRPKNFR